MGRHKNTWQQLYSKTTLNNNGCRIWNGVKDKDGYGLSSISGKKMPAHRALWILWRNKEEVEVEGKYVLHTCHNRACINIDHLYLGTQKQNVQDQVIAGTFVYGSRNGFSKLTEEQVIYARQSTKSIAELSSELNVSYYTMWDVIRKRSWKHL